MSSKLSSLLVQDGVVSVKRMEEAFQRQVIFGGSLDTILLEMNVLDEAVLLYYLWSSTGVLPADFGSIDFAAAQQQTKIFPQRLAEKYLIAPIALSEGTLQVLVTEPPDSGRLDELGFMLGTSIEARIVPEFRLYQALEQIYGVKMPLRYAGLVKRMGPPPTLDLPPAAPRPEHATALQEAPPPEHATALQEAPQPEHATALQEAPPPEHATALQEAPRPERAPSEFSASPLDRAGDGMSGWEDPFAGARPETLVGVPTHPLPEATETAPAAEASALPAESGQEPAPEQARPAQGEVRRSSTKQTAVGMPVRPVEIPETSGPSDPALAGQELSPAPERTEDLEPPGRQQRQQELLESPPVHQEMGSSESSQAPRATPEGTSEHMPAEGAPSLPFPHPAPAEETLAAPTGQDWPFDPTPLSFDEAVEALLRAETRDDIFTMLLRTLAGHFEFCSVFTVFGEQAVGRLAIRRGVPEASRVSQVSIPLTLPSIFRATVDSKGYYFGPIYDEGINFGVLAELERPVPVSAFIMPVLIRNRVVCFTYADHGLRPVAPEIPESLVFISYQVSQAFQRLILRSKRERYSGALEASSAPSKLSQRPQVTARHAPSGSWQAPSQAAEPAPSRAPQREGIFTDPAARAPQTPGPPPAVPSSPSGVQPAFPPLPEPAPPEAQDAAPPEAPPAGAPEGSTPAAEAPEGSLSAVGAAGERAITSVGYYSLSAANIEQDVRGSSSRPAAVVDGVTAGELEARTPGVPSTPQADESPVRVDSSLAPERTEANHAEDIWSLIDDLEQGGEEGDLAAAALQRLGEPALKLVAFRFPGRLLQDRMGQHGQIPPPSAHGPLLQFLIRVGRTAIPYLVDLLDSDNPEVRYYATYTFSELIAPQVLPRLLERIFDSAPPVRRIAVEVLKHYEGTPERNTVLEHLRAELVGPVPFRQQCAAEALGALRDPAAVPRLIELATGRNAETAEAAQRALLLITKQAFGDSRRRWRSWWDKNQHRHRVEWLIDALGHKESECRFLASQELHRLAGETFGYRFDQDRRDREEAQRRWQRWWSERGRARFSS